MEELTDEPSDYGSLRPGTRLGRYELLLPIARGGMARVWAARQHGTRGFQKLVALKTILPHLADEPEFERMFLDEARIASGVHHPNVCEIYELGEERGTLYLAMEWVNGDSFSRALRASGKTEACDYGIAARVIADACAGAHAAHELEDEDGRKLNVVHRDLSPHNILINYDGFTKVCDFGVAKALNQLHEHTQAGQLKGKISYMSPEQVTGDPVDRRSDVFSLGCVLYEATTGQRPFRGEGEHNIMQAIVNGEYAPPSSFVRSYPRDLERIVVRALGNVPNQRFASAEHMRFALEEYLAKGPLVTQSHVATLVRSRLGPMLERRREKIKQASAEQATWDPAPSSREPVDHRSGVKPSQPQLGSSRPDQTSFGRVSTDQILSMNPVGASSSSTIPQAPPALVAAALGEPVETPETGTPIFVTDRAAASASINEAIKSSLVPPAFGGAPPPAPSHVPSPLETSPFGEAVAVDRSLVEARALMAPARDVPIPILSPLTGPPSFEGPPSLAPVAEESPPAGVGQYALAAFVGLLFAVAIGGAGLYYWKSRQEAVIAPPPPPPSVTLSAPAVASSSPPIASSPSIVLSAPVAPAVDAGPAPTASAKKPKAKPKPDPNALPDNPY